MEASIERGVGALVGAEVERKELEAALLPTQPCLTPAYVSVYLRNVLLKARSPHTRHHSSSRDTRSSRGTSRPWKRGGSRARLRHVRSSAICLRPYETHALQEPACNLSLQEAVGDLGSAAGRARGLGATG